MTGSMLMKSPRSIGGGGLETRQIVTMRHVAGAGTAVPKPPKKKPDWGTIVFLLLVAAALVVIAYR